MGHVFMTPMFYLNWNNGFSGGILYDSYYYGLFAILITNIAIIFYMLLDEEVNYNTEIFSKQLRPADPEKSDNYDPTKIKYTDLQYQDRTEYL